MEDDFKPEVAVALPLLKRRLAQLLRGNRPRSRNDYADALDAIADFFEIAGFPEVVIKELLILVTALDELDRGKVMNFLEPAGVKSGPIDSSETWLLRARVAIAIQVLIDVGLPRREAANQLSKRFPEMGPLLSPSSGRKGHRLTAGSLAGVIEKWHERLSTDAIDHPLARIVWEQKGEFVEQERSGYLSVTGSVPNAMQLAEVIAAKVVGYASKQSTPEKIKEALTRQQSARR